MIPLQQAEHRRALQCLRIFSPAEVSVSRHEYGAVLAGTAPQRAQELLRPLIRNAAYRLNMVQRSMYMASSLFAFCSPSLHHVLLSQPLAHVTQLHAEPPATV